MRNIRSRLFLLLLIGHSAVAQRSADTSAVIGEFNEVMAFAVQPYVHYTSVISMQTGPMMPGADSGKVQHGEFYKNGDNLFYSSEQGSIYLQDSLMIKVDHQHKMIQISKVDVATKKNMDVLPLKKTDRQKLLRQHYAISRIADQGDTAAIVMRPQAGQAIGSEMLIMYTKQGHCPVLMQITMRRREPASEKVVHMLQTGGFDVQQMMEDREGRRSLVMTQTASVKFGPIETSREAALQMPLWQQRISYDAATDSFKGMDDWSGYQVVKTF